jgi:multidrug transporter EmrE-like cation transporter
MPYLYLILALVSSTGIALLLKIFEQKEKNRIVIISSNYIVAVILSYLLSQKTLITDFALIFGVVMGFFFFLGFVFLFTAIKKKGIASAVTIGRLSLAIPVAFSLCLWGEKPQLTDIISLILIFFIIFTWEGKIGKVSPILLTVFFIFGFLDSAMKFFKLKFPIVDDGAFLIFIFGSALVWGWFYILVTRQNPKGMDIFWGIVLGVPNFFSSYFLLKALAEIPAYVVFPFINIGIIIITALTGRLLFEEELGRKKIILIILGVIAVFFLSS